VFSGQLFPSANQDQLKNKILTFPNKAKKLRIKKSKIRNLKSKIKSPKSFRVRLGTLENKDLPLALTLSSKVPVGNNADYIEIESHKFFTSSFMPRFSRFVNRKKSAVRSPESINQNDCGLSDYRIMLKVSPML
jgi:hypothetical protein